MFKTIPVYIKLMRDKVEVTNLTSGETATQSASEGFSSSRNVVDKFDEAADTIKLAFRELGIGGGLFPSPLKILIQQLEGVDGGLSDIEKRALRDLAEQVGGRKVYITDHHHRLGNEEAMAELARKPR